MNPKLIISAAQLVLQAGNLVNQNKIREKDLKIEALSEEILQLKTSSNIKSGIAFGTAVLLTSGVITGFSMINDKLHTHHL